MKIGVYLYRNYEGTPFLILLDSIFKECYSSKYEKYEISMVRYYNQNGERIKQKARLVMPHFAKMEYLGRL